MHQAKLLSYAIYFALNYTAGALEIQTSYKITEITNNRNAFILLKPACVNST